MSGDAKKDDHKDEKKKKSFPALIFGVLGALFLVWFALVIANIPVTGAIDALADMLRGVGESFMRLTQSTNVLSRNMNAWIITMVTWVGPVLILGAFVWAIIDDHKKKKAGAHPPADAHPPAGGGH